MPQEPLNWNDLVSDAPVGMPKPEAAGALDAIKTGATHAAEGVLSGVNPVNIVTSLYGVGKEAVNAGMEGDVGGVIDAIGLNPRSAQAVAKKHAQDAYAKGNHTEGALHDVLSALPLVGPLGEDTYNKVLEGVREKDAGKIGDAVGNIGSLLAPVGLGKLAGTKVAKAASEVTMRAAGENYLNTVRPIEPDFKVPAAKAAAEDLARGPAPIAMTRQGLLDKLSAGAAKAGTEQSDAISYDKTGKTAPVQPLLDSLHQYAIDRYTSPKVGGGRVPININGLEAIKDLKDRIVGASGGGTPAPAILAPGQKPPLNTAVTDVALEHTERLRRALEQGTLNNKGDWATDIHPDSVASINRAHAGIIRDWQDTHAPEIQESRDPTRMFSQMRDRLQEATNRAESGTQKTIPIWNKKIPQPIQNSMLNIPWNTVAGATQAKLAKAMARQDWSSATRILQLAKLGVPVGDE